MPLVEPVYPLTHGLTAKALTKLVRATLDTLPELPGMDPAGPPDAVQLADLPRGDDRGPHAASEPDDSELWGTGPDAARL